MTYLLENNKVRSSAPRLFANRNSGLNSSSGPSSERLLALFLRPDRRGHQEAALLRRGDRAETSGHGRKRVLSEDVGRGEEGSTDVFLTQDTGKLRIGTYTGDLQHGTVYSGGEGGLPVNFGLKSPRV